MQPLLKQYLSGTLESTGAVQKGQISFTSWLDVPVWAGFLAPDGTVYPLVQVPSGASGLSQSGPTNWYWLVWGLDGGVAAVFAPSNASPLPIIIGAADLSDPGDIGPVPMPSADILIPNDSRSILVGCGTARDTKGVTYVMRSQFWKRSADSITIESTETVTTGYTATTGLQETSSHTATVAESISASASAGWGPVSASLSASLNSTDSTFQQYVATETDSIFESHEYTPDPKGTVMIFRWQLYDVVTIVSAQNDEVVAQVTTAQHPDVVTKSYLDDLQVSARRELSESERRELNTYLGELRRASS